MDNKQESITIILALDNKQLEQGLLRMVARQEVAAIKTKALWAEADRAMQLEHLAAVEKMIASDEQYKLAKISITQQILTAEKAADAARVESAEVAAQARIAVAKAALEEEELLAKESQAVALGNAGTIIGASEVAGQQSAGMEKRLAREGSWAASFGEGVAMTGGRSHSTAMGRGHRQYN
jgi:hypothetical protein